MARYPDYIGKAIRDNEKDAVLFASVGLGWLSRISAQKAERLRSQNNLKSRKSS